LLYWPLVRKEKKHVENSDNLLLRLLDSADALDLDFTCKIASEIIEFSNSNIAKTSETTQEHRFNLICNFATKILKIINDIRLVDNDNSSYWNDWYIREIVEDTVDFASKFNVKNATDLAEAILIMGIDFATLLKRIAGRSPAFEGIRLVKERIK
jgi:hypothetical protein